jgi:hypothetical protein
VTTTTRQPEKVTMLPSRHDELIANITALADAHRSGDDAAIDAAAAALAQPVFDVEPRKPVSMADRIAVHERDSWTCRYCGRKTFAPPVLRLLSELHPEQFPFHPNWKTGATHEAYHQLSASLDHVHPFGQPGHSADLVTACWRCNACKSEFTLADSGQTLLSEEAVRSDWRGLADRYDDLWQEAGQPAFDAEWRRMLRAAHITREES